MAYRTSWKLEISKVDGSDVEPSVREKIKEYVETHEDMEWVFSEGLGEWGEDDRSFSESDRHMRDISNTFNNVLFTLKYEMIDDTAEGMYTEYWFKGLVQREKLQYYTPEFDESKCVKAEI